MRQSRDRLVFRVLWFRFWALGRVGFRVSVLGLRVWDSVLAVLGFLLFEPNAKKKDTLIMKGLLENLADVLACIIMLLGWAFNKKLLAKRWTSHGIWRSPRNASPV